MTKETLRTDCEAIAPFLVEQYGSDNDAVFEYLLGHCSDKLGHRLPEVIVEMCSEIANAYTQQG